MHSNWRDLEAWKEADLPMTTASNEAAKLYDAVLTQYIGWYDDPGVGGIESSVTKMLAADENFAMGHVIGTGLDLIGTGQSIHTSKDLKTAVENMSQLLTKNKTMTRREKLHIQAVENFACSDMFGAVNVWEEILLDHPTDMLALKFAHDSYFYLGQQRQMRDSIERVFPHWNASMPLYSYLYGMSAFGWIETNFYDEAEKCALKALELNPRDCWATHAQAHVLEMGGRAGEGVTFLTKTENDWNKGEMLACHNYWHLALYQIEQGNHAAAVDVYDEQIGKRCKSGAMLDLVDAASLLYRLEMEGIGGHDERWKEQLDLWTSHLDDRILVFNDAHMLMCALGAKNREASQKFMTSIREFIRHGSGTQHDICKRVGLKLLEAMELFDKGDAAGAVDLLHPLRYNVIDIGGSNAQRDLWQLFLIHAALQSSKKEHHCLARSLLVERKAMKKNAPMTDRLMARALALH